MKTANKTRTELVGEIERCDDIAKRSNPRIHTQPVRNRAQRLRTHQATSARRTRIQLIEIPEATNGSPEKSENAAVVERVIELVADRDREPSKRLTARHVFVLFAHPKQGIRK